MLSPAAASAVRPPGFKHQHRGTRSFDAVCRRLSAWRTRFSHVNVTSSEAVVIPPNGDTDAAIAIVAASPSACESRSKGLDNSSFSFLLANVQGFVSKSADLAFFHRKSELS